MYPDSSHGDDADATALSFDESSQIADVAGQELITRKRKQGHQGVDDVRRPSASEQLTRILRVVESHCADIDHGQRPSKASLPPAVAPRLTDYG